MSKETVGQKSMELLAQGPDSRDPIELERAMHQDYEKHVFECIDRGKKEFDGDFFVVVITKKEPLMQNVLRNYFTCRVSCPTPDYDQTVYHYKRADEQISFVWIIPSKDACLLLKENALQVAPEEQGLLKFVLDFADGTLYKLAKKLNGEEPDSNLLVN